MITNPTLYSLLAQNGRLLLLRWMQNWKDLFKKIKIVDVKRIVCLTATSTTKPLFEENMKKLVIGLIIGMLMMGSLWWMVAHKANIATVWTKLTTSTPTANKISGKQVYWLGKPTFMIEQVINTPGKPPQVNSSISGVSQVEYGLCEDGILVWRPIQAPPPPVIPATPVYNVK